MTGEFWSMGGYAAFVWPCFAFVTLVLAWNVWSARRRLATARIAAVRAIAMAESDAA